MGTAQGGVRAAGAGGDPERDAGRDRLPGTGDADRQRAGELLAGRGRHSAAAMGKKNAEEMAKQRDRFVSGAVARGHSKDTAGDIFDQMDKFAGYGFNKSHAAAYALLAYQTAYLKTHYPVEFMAALLTSETSKPESVVKYIGECREMGIPRRAAGRAGFGRAVHAARRGDPLRAGGGEERGRQRDRVDPEGAR